MRHGLHSAPQNQRQNNGAGFALVWAIITLVLAIIAFTAMPLFLKTSKSTNPNACITKSFASGDSGQCVNDLQNMVNNLAFGIDGQLYIKATSSYDAATVNAVKTFQKNFNLPQTGSVSSKDWAQLCKGDYSSPLYTTAAKDAGC